MSRCLVLCPIPSDRDDVSVRFEDRGPSIGGASRVGIHGQAGGSRDLTDGEDRGTSILRLWAGASGNKLSVHPGAGRHWPPSAAEKRPWMGFGRSRRSS